jgi:hypothetical protein
MLSMVRCIAITLSMLMLASIGCADIAVEGMRQYDYNYSITNLGEYPDYVFLTSSAIWGWEFASEINGTGSFSGGYKLDGFQVHAIKAKDLDQGMLNGSASDDEAQAARKEYFEGNKDIVSSNLTLPVAASLEEALGLKNITVHLKVNSINESSLNISETEVVYGYLDGRTEELPVEDDNIPDPSNRTGAL